MNFALGINPPDLSDPSAFAHRFDGADACVLTLPQDPEALLACSLALPGTIFLAYVNACNLPRQWAPDSYWQSFWKAFPESAFLTDLSTGQDFSLAPTPDPATNNSHYILCPTAITFWKDWVVAQIKSLGFYGLYWDDAHWRVTTYLMQRYQAQPLDMTHDGKADSAGSIEARYNLNRPKLTAAVRESWPEAIQVCNTGGPCPDPSIHGCTIEVNGYIAPVEFDASVWRRPVYAAAVAMDGPGDRYLKQGYMPPHVGVAYFTDRSQRIPFREW